MTEDVLKVLAAVAAGGLIGAEREFRDKSAGFRTLIFICLGATLFTMFSIKLGGPDDPVRMAANVVTGIGFLGAGAILREGLRVKGLTTAAAIWLVAALGVGIAGGYFALVAVTVVVALVVLWLFPYVEIPIDRFRETRTYEVGSSAGRAKLDDLEEVFTRAGLRIRSHRQVKQGARILFVWTAEGRPEAHQAMMRLLLDDPAFEDVESRV